MLRARDQIISAMMEHEFHLAKNNESERAAAAAIYCYISRDAGKKCWVSDLFAVMVW